jgi:hypothetical protein
MSVAWVDIPPEFNRNWLKIGRRALFLSAVGDQKCIIPDFARLVPKALVFNFINNFR